MINDVQKIKDKPERQTDQSTFTVIPGKESLSVIAIVDSLEDNSYS